MIDKTEIECRFRRSVDSYEDNATVQKWIVQRLVELLQEYVPYSSRTLEIGCGTGLLSEKINRLWEDQQFWVNDLVEQMCRKTIARCQLPVSHGLNGDIEQIPLTGKFDLIVSASTFQWLAHPRATFAKLAAHLNTNGWLIFSTFGKNNFKELKAVTGQGLEYRSIGELSAWLSSEYDILYTEEQIHMLKFSDPLDILRHVKKTGVNATSLPTAWTKGRLREFCEDYKIRFLTDGYCPLSYHPLYLVCRKK